jgi:uncharacterized integral membrane protein
MGRIITTVITVVVLAVLVSMNLGFITSVNLFGRKFDDVPVVTVAALSFALGVVYSLLISFGILLHNRAKRGLDGRSRRLSEREKELAKRQGEADAASVASKALDGRRVGPHEKNGVSPAGQSRLAKFLGFFKARP